MDTSVDTKGKINFTPSIPHTGIQLTNKDEIQLYVYGGKGRFRMKSKASDKEFVYKISPMSKRNERYDEYTFYVSLVVDGGSDFLGVMKAEDNHYIHSKRSFHKFDSPAVKGVRWLLHQFTTDNDFPEMMEFFHMGVCSCCGKALTTPESVEMGIGPVCFKRYGNKRLKKLLHLKKKIEQKMARKAKTLASE